MNGEQAAATPTYVEERPESLAWYKAWGLTLLRPSDRTFQRLINDPRATTRRAHLWLLLAALSGTATLTGALLLLNLLSARASGVPLARVWVVIFAVTPVWTVLLWGTLRLTWLLARWIGPRLGGAGQPDDVWYLLAAVYSPLLALLPAAAMGQTVTWFLWLYGLTQTVLVLKFAYRLTSWVRAFIVGAGALLGAFIMVGIVLAGILTVFGPLLGAFLRGG